MEHRPQTTMSQTPVAVLSGESFVRWLLARARDRHAEGDGPPWLTPRLGACATLPQVLRGCGVSHLPASGRAACWWEGIDGSRVLIGDPPGADETLPVRRGGMGGTIPAGAGEPGALRRVELLLREAELLAALCPGNPAAMRRDETVVYPQAELAEAWALLLRGCAGAETDLARLHALGDGIIAQGLAAFAARIDTGGLEHPLAVWNTLSFPRSGIVSVPWHGNDRVVAYSPRAQTSRTQLTTAQGERRLLVEVVDAPPMGYVVYDLRVRMRVKDHELAITDAARTDGRVLENTLVRVELNDAGEVTAFYDKQQGRQLIAAGEAGNRFLRVDGRGAGRALSVPGTLTAVERGPLRATVRVERALTPRSRLVQWLRLEANTRRLDIETRVEWPEDARLAMAFPLALRGARATGNLPFGHDAHPARSLRDTACGHKWCDLSERDYGVALLNDGPCDYAIRGREMRIYLPAATTFHGTCSLLPHRGEVEYSGVPLAGYDLNVPFRVQPLPVQHGILARAHSYFRLDRPNLVIESVKRAEDGDGLIVRLYDAYRRGGSARLIVNGLCARATRTDLLERHLEPLPVHGGAVTFSYRPFEIVTLRLH